MVFWSSAKWLTSLSETSALDLETKLELSRAALISAVHDLKVLKLPQIRTYVLLETGRELLQVMTAP